MTFCDCPGEPHRPFCPSYVESGEIDHGQRWETASKGPTAANVGASTQAVPTFSTVRDSADHRPTGDKSHEPSILAGLRELATAAVAAAFCPHGRQCWTMCPWCNGINQASADEDGGLKIRDAKPVVGARGGVLLEWVDCFDGETT